MPKIRSTKESTRKHPTRVVATCERRGGGTVKGHEVERVDAEVEAPERLTLQLWLRADSDVARWAPQVLSMVLGCPGGLESCGFAVHEIARVGVPVGGKVWRSGASSSSSSFFVRSLRVEKYDANGCGPPPGYDDLQDRSGRRESPGRDGDPLRGRPSRSGRPPRIERTSPSFRSKSNRQPPCRISG
jgi:hypothetical protein